ncbi:YceI family protein [Paraglaciecola sp. MB-3u-78]|uniref:YceI family protein n=1 Tax=Paraglaciecola sp. MB-3u-78 TaxID=2058332 RepID=UPI001E298412|nr:YceI family protein [Paraglaciecola sp. MB-3u-78]
MSFFIALYLSLATTVVQAELKSSHQSGSVAFSGQHAGMNFEGKFERWEATLTLPPQSNPSIIATFYMSSAKTGDSIYDSTLPEFDWFDVENHALGKFVSTKIEMTEEGYQVLGDLTIKNITQPVNFMLIDSQDQLSTSFGINRLDYKIGWESDPDAEWVSKTIFISMVINK